MLFLFIYLFVFFTTLRKISFRQMGRKLDWRNVVWIIWITFLILVEVLNLILRDILTPLMLFDENSVNEKNPFLVFYSNNRFIWFSLTDFIVGSTILYLFYQ